MQSRSQSGLFAKPFIYNAIQAIHRFALPTGVVSKTGTLFGIQTAVQGQRWAQKTRNPQPVLGKGISCAHHERFDGTEYPQKLRREKLPFYARIFAVADAFDAMTTQRPDQTQDLFRKRSGRFAGRPPVRSSSPRRFPRRARGNLGHDPYGIKGRTPSGGFAARRRKPIVQFHRPSLTSQR